MAFSSHLLAAHADSVSPGGGAEIRQILALPEGELTHATCRPGHVAAAHLLPELDELYFVLAGEGEVWRASGDREAVTALKPGRWVQMPRGTRFQYRTSPGSTLVFLVVVMPRWQAGLFHLVDGGPWPTGVEDRTPATNEQDLVDGWMSGDLPRAREYPAPDGSEIRTLGSMRGGSLAHCTLGPGLCTRPVRHRTVHELWFVVAGFGELWRAAPDGDEDVVLLQPGLGVDIPRGSSFQFRSTGADALSIVILTMPEWPGPSEAVPTEEHWAATVTSGGSNASG